MGGRQMVERIAARHPSVTTDRGAGTARGGVGRAGAERLRLGLDYLRFLDAAVRRHAAPCAGAPKSARRAGVVRLADVGLWRAVGGGRRGLARLLGALERGLPVAPATRRVPAREAPDAVLITPLVDIGLAAARSLRGGAARSACARCCRSGAGITCRARRCCGRCPTRVLVWNEVQRREAVDMHGVPAERVVVTGAQCYDQWFDRGAGAQPRGRSAPASGCGPIGRSSCTSARRSSAAPPSEPAFVEALDPGRAQQHATRGCKDIGILVRPHPARLDEWTDGRTCPGTATWRSGAPIRWTTRRRTTTSTRCTTAPPSSGLNTSAFIEAAVVGKPVHTVLLPEISDATTRKARSTSTTC